MELVFFSSDFDILFSFATNRSPTGFNRNYSMCIDLHVCLFLLACLHKPIHDANVPFNVSVARSICIFAIRMFSAHLFQLHFMSHGIEASFISYLTYYGRSILRNGISTLALHSLIPFQWVLVFYSAFLHHTDTIPAFNIPVYGIALAQLLL